jgi:sterol desaturase/sphingolipid hydroxylase (fatty acid hydroxylase superfamily)
VIFFGSSISPITLFNANIGLVAFNLFGGTLRHSHIWFSYGPQLEKFFISPAMHQIHHSAERRHFDKNLGYHLAIWDRLAGTLHIPEGREIFALGIGPEGERIRGVTSSLVQPVVSTLATLVPRARPST